MWQADAQRSGRLLFEDRVAAGRVLAEHLRHYQRPRPLILGIPRGGVPVAAEIARRLDGDLDVIVARKLGAPGQPELAIGAATANGGLWLDEEMIARLGIPETFLDSSMVRERAEAARREQSLRGIRPAVPIAGRTVIVVDDGLATGATMRAAVRSARKHDAAMLVVAVPVGAPEACVALEREVDELVCPYRPESFRAVGSYYRNFEATSDDEVRGLLRDAVAVESAAGRAEELTF